MIIELLQVVSVIGEQSIEKLCKVCYGEDDQDGWLRPCKCCGTLKWVHKECFNIWMKKAPGQQKIQCQTCRHFYEKLWSLKPLQQWCKPPLQLSTWDYIEIILDTYATYKFLRGFWWTVEGRRALWVQFLHFIFWRTFIGNNRRIAMYKSMGISCMSSIFEMQVKDYEDGAVNDKSLIIMDKQVIDEDRIL